MIPGLLSYFRWTSGLAASPANMRASQEALLRSALAIEALGAANGAGDLRTGIPAGHMVPTLDAGTVTLSPGYALIASTATDPLLLGPVTAAVLAEEHDEVIGSPAIPSRPCFTSIFVAPEVGADTESVEAFHTGGSVSASPADVRAPLQAVVASKTGVQNDDPPVAADVGGDSRYVRVAVVYHAADGSDILFDARPILDTSGPGGALPIRSHPLRGAGVPAPVWTGTGFRFYYPRASFQTEQGLVSAGDVVVDVGAAGASNRLFVAYVDNQTEALGTFDAGTPPPGFDEEAVSVLAPVGIPSTATDGGDCSTAALPANARFVRGASLDQMFAWEGVSWSTTASNNAALSLAGSSFQLVSSDPVTFDAAVIASSGSLLALDATRLDLKAPLIVATGEIQAPSLDVSGAVEAAAVQTSALTVEGGASLGALPTHVHAVQGTLNLAAATVELPATLRFPGGIDGWITKSVPFADFEVAFERLAVSDPTNIFSAYANRRARLFVAPGEEADFLVPLRLPDLAWVRQFTVSVRADLDAPADIADAEVDVRLVVVDADGLITAGVTPYVTAPLVDGSVVTISSAVLARTLPGNINLLGSEICLQVRQRYDAGADPTGTVRVLYAGASIAFGVNTLFPKV